MYGEVARKCSSTVRSEALLMRFVEIRLYWSIDIAIVSLGWTLIRHHAGPVPKALKVREDLVGGLRAPQRATCATVGNDMRVHRSG